MVDYGIDRRVWGKWVEDAVLSNWHGIIMSRISTHAYGYGIRHAYAYGEDGMERGMIWNRRNGTSLHRMDGRELLCIMIQQEWEGNATAYSRIWQQNIIVIFVLILIYRTSFLVGYH